MEAAQALSDIGGCELFVFVDDGGEILVQTGETDENWIASARNGDPHLITVYVPSLAEPVLVFMHELLHLMGFDHVEDDPSNLMHPYIDENARHLTVEQKERIRDWCPNPAGQ